MLKSRAKKLENDKLPIDHGIQEALKIYAKRLGLFFAVVIAGYVLLALVLAIQLQSNIRKITSSEQLNALLVGIACMVLVYNALQYRIKLKRAPSAVIATVLAITTVLYLQIFPEVLRDVSVRVALAVVGIVLALLITIQRRSR